jgi:hypothetical protein
MIEWYQPSFDYAIDSPYWDSEAYAYDNNLTTPAVASQNNKLLILERFELDAVEVTHIRIRGHLSDYSSLKINLNVFDGADWIRVATEASLIVGNWTIFSISRRLVMWISLECINIPERQSGLIYEVEVGYEPDSPSKMGNWLKHLLKSWLWWDW